jgi:hypothetical protein
MLTVIEETRWGVAAAAASAFGGIISEVGAAMLVGAHPPGRGGGGRGSFDDPVGARSAAMLGRDTIS